MCLPPNSKAHLRKRALLTTTATSCLLSFTSVVSAIQIADTQEAELVPVSAAEAASSPATPTDTVVAGTAALQSDIDVYAAAFFDQYSPQNALDMIQRLPGFSFDRGSNVRGFGGAAGNVLIDGSRPTSKSGGLQASLERIPAAQVLRIEIIRGGVSGGEAAGQSTVANVIRKQTGSSGTWEFKLRRSSDGRIAPNIEGAITGKIGAWDTSFDIDIGGWVGYRTAFLRDLDAVDALQSSSDEIVKEENEWLQASGEASRDFAGGKLTLNGRWEGNNWNGDTTRDGFNGRLPDTSPDDFWLLGEREERREVEFGADWTKTYSNNWKWRLIGLANNKDQQYGFQSDFEDFQAPSENSSSFFQDRENSEYIFRTTYGLTTGKFKPEFGIEGARNQMDSDIEYFEDGVMQELDPANVTVREYRAEAFATFNYQASNKLSLDGGLTYEASQIKVSGDASNKQTVKFWKPRLSATYSFDEDLQLTLEAERQVGQLNFNLFAANTNAQDARETGGNAQLRPDTKWRTSTTLDWKFSERGSIKAEAFYEWRSDILEEIVLPSGSVGRGNAGSARFYGFEIEGNFPLDKVLKGGLLEARYNHRRATFKDPILGGETRRVSWFTPSWLSFEFRQDITSAKVSWGAEYWGSFADEGFLVDQIQRIEGNKRWSLFVETTRYFDVKIRLLARLVNTGRFTRSRFFFDGDRSGEFIGSEISERKLRPRWLLEISGTF